MDLQDTSDSQKGGLIMSHEAISRFFEMGLTVPEVALISGHKDVKMLFLYTHMRVDIVVSKLA